MPKIGDTIIWKNRNTNTIEKSKVQSIVDETVALGDHYVSWVHKDDIEVIEVTNEKPEQQNSNRGNYSKKDQF